MNTFKAIKTEKDYEVALKRLEKVFDAQSGPDADEAEVLAILIEDYEEKNYPIGDPDPIEYIKLKMETMGLKRADLVKYIGSESRVSEILNGKRQLTQNMIVALHKGLKIPLESLMLGNVNAIMKKVYAHPSNQTQLAREPKTVYKVKKKKK